MSHQPSTPYYREYNPRPAQLDIYARDRSGSPSDSELATPPPGSPYPYSHSSNLPSRNVDDSSDDDDDEWVEDEYGLMVKVTKPECESLQKSVPRAREKRPDEIAREEMFDQLAYCGFLDISFAHLIRWAAVVAWDIQLYRQSRCYAQHSSVSGMHIFADSSSSKDNGNPKTPVPPVLFKLFGENALLPTQIRTSATTRALIVLHALWYLSKVPSCALCMIKAHEEEKAYGQGPSSKKRARTTVMNRSTGKATPFPAFANLDLSQERKSDMGGVDKSLISKIVVDWSVAVRCAFVMLVDHPMKNYWETHTRHIPDAIGTSTTTFFQRALDYNLNIDKVKLMQLMDLVTDQHPLALAPQSRRRYRLPNGVTAMDFESLVDVD
ncbi:hypothetical protein PIIN_07892 [Serendipita indica DSM 11827]|uniref:Uncharacterized protein n=1 Tax=Serendipita indica (strain DSM 11827) TaxID=1109443 RepID=G4TRJ6_SERID|nr:hypothetical protein PIIN_07892 [Serendipita indica DSM 11827]